jgi:hypothetical protein
VAYGREIVASTDAGIERAHGRQYSLVESTGIPRLANTDSLRWNKQPHDAEESVTMMSG